MVYYNEFDPKAAAWLRELIKTGLIAPGDVDERDIREVQPADLVGYTQHHFFAGIGGWSYALRLAGWPDNRPVWTGSCPCQPFSTAGKGLAEEDKRHLWPEFRRLIALCRPPVVFGEQVASKAGRTWLAAVRADVERVGYALGAADLCAAGVEAPHIRQRLWFVADAQPQLNGSRSAGSGGGTQSPDSGDAGVTGHSHHARPQGQFIGGNSPNEWIAGEAGVVGGLANPESRHGGLPVSERRSHENRAEPVGGGETGGASPPHGGWSTPDWLYCRDNKWRPVEPGTFPLAHGVPARVGRLRGYGNAIVPQLAAEFILAYREVREG